MLEKIKTLEVYQFIYLVFLQGLSYNQVNKLILFSKARQHRLMPKMHKP